MSKFSFFKSTTSIILTTVAVAICAYVAWQLGKLSEKVEKGSKTLATLSLLLIMPAVILFFYFVTQLNFLEYLGLMEVIEWLSKF